MILSQHPRHKEIVAAMLAGEPLASIARRFDIRTATLSNYRRSTFAPALKAGLLKAGVAPEAALKSNAYTPYPDSLPQSIHTKPGALAKRMEAMATISGTKDLLSGALSELQEGVEWARESRDVRGLAQIARSKLAGIRLVAELSGELEQRPAQSISIVIMGSDPPMPKGPADDPGLTIDAEANQS